MAGFTQREWRELAEQENERRLADLDLHLLHIAKLAEDTKVPGGLFHYVADTLALLLPEEEQPRRGRRGVFRKKPIPAKLRWEVFGRDDFMCCECESQEDLTADHIHPESEGGEATIDNLQTLCRSCNSRKGARV